MMTLSVVNPNFVTTLTGIAFSDTLPTGLAFNGDFSAPICGGTISVSGATISLTGGTEAPTSGDCNIALPVNANGAATGLLTNTTSAVTSTNGGTGNSASAQITVNLPPPKYRSRQSGAWNDFTSWQVDSGSGFVDAVSGQTPTSADDTITIQNGHTVSVTANVNADQVTVELGANLSVISGTTLTIDDGTGTDLDVNGITEVNGTAVISGAGLFSLNSGATLTIGDANGISTAACGTGSTCGSIRTVTRSFSGTANYNYNNGSAQATGNALTSVNNLSVQSGTVLSLTTGVTVNGTFNVNTGTTLHTGINTLSGAGVFNLFSGATLGIGSAAGITSSGGTGNVQTATRNFNTGATYNYNGSTNQSVGNGLPATVANLTISNTGTIGNNTVTGNPGQAVTGSLNLVSGVYASASDYHHVVINSSGTLSISNPITVSGDWTNNGTFTNNGFGVTFDGTGAQTITTGGTVAGKTFAGFTVNKSSGTATLAGDLRALTVTITAGTFNQGASFSVQTTAGGAVASVGTNGIWENFGTGDLTLSGNISNAGTISFNGNGTACNELATNDISISSTGGARTWSGTGTFSMTDVTVANQSSASPLPPIAILVNSGTDGGGNTGWVFVDQCTAGTYTWIGGTLGANTDWQVSTNWNPARATPAAGDVLIFDGASTPAPIVTNVPTQTISSLQLKNSANAVQLNAAALGPHTLTITGNAGLDVQAVSRLELVGSTGLTIAVTTGSASTINGQMALAGGPHQLTGANAGQIVFASGSIFTASTGFTGHPFGQGTDGSVIFQSGASAFFNAGSDPFGGSGNEIVTFNLGSNQEFSASTAFDSNGRTYGNLTLTGATTFNGSGANPLTVTGNFALGSSTTVILSGTAGGDMVVNGNFTDGNTLASAFQSNGRIVTFSGGSSTQTISKAGVIGEIFAHLRILKTGGSVKLLSEINVNGSITFAGVAGNAVDVLEMNGKGVSLPGTLSSVPDANSGFKGDQIGASLFIGGSVNPLGNPIHFVSGGEFLNLFFVDRASGVSVDTNLTIGHPTTTPNGNLTLTNGVLDMGANTLTLNPNATLSRTTGYVSGNLKKNFGATGAFNFAVGTANGYSPVGVNVTAGTGDLTVKAVQGPQPNITGANALQRYWTLNGTGITADLTFNYLDPTDIPGTANESLFVIFKYDGSFSTPGGTVNTGANTATINGVSSFSDWTLAEAAAVQEGALEFSSATYTEAENVGGGTVTITVNRTGGSDGAVSVDYATVVGGTATGGATCVGAPTFTDYLDASGTLNFADNETSKTFTITLCNDIAFEPNDTVNLALSNPQGGATLGAQNTSVLNITSEDAAPTISINDVTAAEGNAGTTNFTFNIFRVGSPSQDPINIAYHTVDVGAVAPGDYSAVAAGNTSIAAFGPSVNITISVNGDTDFEPDETFNVVLDSVSVGTIGDGTGVGTITNDDAAPTPDVSVALFGAASVAENSGTPLVYRFTRTDSSSAITVNFAATGTADPNNDYAVTGTDVSFTPGTASGTIDFGVGESQKDVSVTPSDDGDDEPDETVILTVASGTGYNVGTPASDTGTITDDDVTCPTTLEVNDAGDGTDFNPGDGICETAAGNGMCTLRAAIMEVNALTTCTSSITITFNIGGSGVQTIQPASALPVITQPVFIDGYSQPGSSMNTLAAGNDAVINIELDGTNAGSAFIPGLVLGGGSSGVQGLIINRFSGQGIHIPPGSDNNAIIGNFIGTDATGLADAGNALDGVFIEGSTNEVGCEVEGERNVISGNDGHGVQISGSPAQFNVVSGNYIGTDKNGTAAVPNSNVGLMVIQGSFNLIGSTDPIGRNVISGNNNSGVQLHQDGNGNGGSDNVVIGNYIGVDVTGATALPNTGTGLNVFGKNNQIGGTIAGSRNVISGNGLWGMRMVGGVIDLNDGVSGNIVQGNYIGVAADGTTAMGNGWAGIDLSNASTSTIGGLNPGEANVIANNGNAAGAVSKDGISITKAAGPAPANQNLIRGNSIYNNGQLGIDLVGGTESGSGVTTNDVGDGDTGPNDLQNFPVITSATVGSTTVSGTIDSVAGNDTIDIYLNTGCDPSGNGEGQTWLASGSASGGTFTITVPTITAGQIFTATATDAATNTSEFSACFTAAAATAPEIDVKGNGISIADGDNSPSLADGTDFGSFPSSHTFTIDNLGSSDLTLSGTPFVQITGANPSDFIVTSQPSSPVGASGSTSFTIFAGASAPGTRTATVSIANDDSDENPYTFDIQILGLSVLTVTPATTPTAADNDYTRINNAVQASFSGQTIKLLGTFNWTEANAAASWALGSDGLTGGANSDDDYGITPPAGLNNVTFTADNLGDGSIQGPGDLAGVNLEGVFSFFRGQNQNWTISNIRFLDFDLSIGMFAIATTDFNNTNISNNYIRMARDLNATVAPADVNQNIAIHFSFGANQTISGNTIEIQGDGISAGANFASDVGMQSNTSGGAVYDGLQITNNIVRVLNAQDAANPQVVLGIWENGHAHTSDITVSGNQFLNPAAGNNPATNLQRAFRVTSHSSATTTVTYSGNSISGANIGFQWLAATNFSGNQPVIVEGNTITNNGTGLLVQSQGLANIRFNRIVGNTTGLNNIDGIVTAENNWWGCNTGPGTAGCDSVTGTADFDPWVVLLVSASPSSITPGGTSTVTADMTRNSAVGNPAHGGAATLPLPDAAFSATNGTMLPTTNSFSSGLATSTFTSTNSSNGSACVDVDNQQTCTTITVTAPSFSVNDVTMAEGNGGPGSTSFIFTITKTGATALNASVNYETVDGTAVSPTDFTAIPVTNVTFLPSETTKQVTVFVNGELAVEPDETFTLQLSNASGATIGDASGLGTIQNDDACPPQATVYVDDNFANPTVGEDPDGGGPATNFGCDSFATIQGGVDGVAPGGTVIVNAGTYNEDVNVHKAGVSVLGAGAGSVSVIGPIGGAGATFQITASNVTLAGMTITRAGNNTTDWNNPGLNSVGVAIQGLSITGALIRDNVITGNRTGIDINNSGGHTVRNNVIDFNRTGLIFRNQTDQMTVIENFITNNWTVGVLFLDASGGTNSPVQTSLHSTYSNNSISANWYGQIVDRQTGGSLPPPATTNYKNFRGNWFGTTSPVVTTANSAEPGYAAQIPVAYGGTATPPGGQPDIAGPASANFQYTPFLLSGTDTNVETVPGRGTNGFQGVANTVVVSYVTPNGWFFFDDLPGTGTGSGGFEIGPATPPLGNGSAFLTVDSQGRHALGVFNYNGTRADDLLALLYQSYQNNNANTVVANSLQFDIDYDLNDAATAYSGRLVFEPYLSPAQGAVAQNVWQNWDARGGMWYGTRTTVTVNNVAGVTQPCQPASPCTWAQVLSLFPNAGVRNAAGSAVLFKAGGPWAPGFDGNVDNFRLQHNGALVTYDFEPGPQLSINDVTQVETNAGTTAFTFNVTLTESSSQTITVNYQTADDSATTSDLDYVAVPSTGITFNPGETSKPVTVFVNGDTKFELNDQFFVNLSGPVNASILDGQGVGTITNDDTQPTISIDDVTAFEGDSGTTNFNFTVSLSNPSYLPVTVTAETANGTATTADSDYNGVAPTIVTISANTTTQTFQVQVNGDTKFELDETFFVNLSLPSNATIADPQGMGTITNDDAAPTISINDLATTEGTTAVPPPTKQFNFTVTKSGTTSEQATVNYQTADDTGGANPATSGADCSTPGVDYIPTSGTVIFPAAGPGSTSQTVTVLVCRDSVFEPNETFLVNLSGQVNATIGDGQAVGTINNDDVPAGGFVVNTTADTIDDNLCLPIGSGNGCTLREAINAVNASPSATAINFAIPANDARHFYYKDDGVPNQVTNDVTHVLVTTAANDAALPADKDPDWPHGWWSILPTSALPAVTQAATVDGYTQTDAAVNTSATSTNAVLRIEVEGSSAGAAVTGLVVSNGSSIVRGLVINRFTSHGLQSSGAVTGNFIGADVSGTLDLGNTESGVLGANNMTIGGNTPALANLLSGNDNHGVLFTNFNSSIVQGNYIGAKADGVSALGNSGNGVHLAGGSAVFNTIGGTAAGEANTIAFNGNDGVSLPDAGIGNVIRGNSIFSNGTTAAHLGIDHGPVDGVTANDAAPDADSGPNALQNFPVIQSAVVGSPNLISGTLSSAPNQTFSIDLYANAVCDTSGNGEGKTYLGSTTTTTDSNGLGGWRFSPATLNLTDQITATATSATNNTSEFSQCFTPTTFSAGQLQFAQTAISDPETNTGSHTVTFTVQRVGGSNRAASVNYTINDGSATIADNDYSVSSPTGTLQWPNGDATDRTITITVNGDTKYEGDETVTIVLSSPVGATIAGPDTATLTITDDDLLLVDDDLVQCPTAAYTTIQSAINAALAGQTVQVCAGTYEEQVTVNKSLTVVGPNANINPNTGVRVAEAIISPTASDPLNPGFAGPIVVTFTASGVTFKGFTVDGDNPLNNSGVVFNGADVDAEFGIYGDGSADMDAVIENNIVKNIGEIAIWLNTFGIGGARNANSRMTANKVDNVLGAFGQALRISDDCWADVTNNVVTRSRVGIVIENFSGNVTTHPASVIENNDVTTFRIGIRHNLHYVYGLPGFTIRNNTVQSYVQTPMPSQVTTPTTYEGIRVESIQQTVDVDITNNTVDGNRAALQTAGYTRVEGLGITNASAVSPNISFTGNRSFDNIRGVFHDTPAVPTFTCNTIVGNSTGVEISANATNGLIANNNNIFGNGVGMLNNSPAGSVNAENNYWGSATGPTIASNPTGTGDSITGTGAAAVDYDPFLTSAASCAPVAPPTISKAFGTVSVPPNGSTTLSFTIGNPNSSTLTGIGFTDPLPSGLIVATPNGLTGSCGGGTITAADGSSSISLSGATLTAGTTCTFTVNVQVNTLGTKNNTTGNVSSTEGGVGGTASASLNVTPPSLSINDVTLAEGTGGTTNFVFTVTKTGDGAADVNFTTVDGTAQDDNPVSEDNDYAPNNGTLSFGVTEPTKTITVMVNGDATPELIENFTVVLSGPTGGATITDDTGLGTILNDDESAAAGQLIISEFRFSGPGVTVGQEANDEFIELYNNTDADIFVTTTDGSTGWAVANSSGVPIFFVPNGTTIPARGHFLGTNTTGYSLKDYGGTDAALGDATWTTDIPDNTAITAFRTNNAANFNATNRLDSVGPNTETNPLYKEAAGYAPLVTPNLEHTFFRQICVFQAGCPTPGRPRDTEDNAADFIYANTQGTPGDRLGAPGPENLASPIKRDPAINLLLLDATVGDATAPNRVRDTNPDAGNASTFGTMTIRRRVVNQTGNTVTRLRFRVIDMTTHPSGSLADLRLRSSAGESINGINDPNTCASTGTPTTPTCTVNVTGLTLEQPPNQPVGNGGGMNSTVTLPGGLAPGQSINVNFLLGVQKTGAFRFYLVIEALP